MNNPKVFIRFCSWTAAIMTLVLFWDHYTLKVDNLNLGYLMVKAITIIGLVSLGLFSRKYDKVSLLQQDLYGLLFYFYSFYGMVYLDMTYSFSFIEAYFILSLGMRTTAKRFIMVQSVGLIGLIFGHYFASEPAFVAVGQSYAPHSMTVSLILFIVATFLHFILTRQQNLINDLNEKFAMVGKQSSFLMHEIKNPLSRIVANSEEYITETIINDIRRDSQKISALVNSVEVLIHNPKSLAATFTHFDWSDIAENLHLDFNSYLISMNINFNYSGLAGEFYGNKPLMYQLIKNSIVNAIEAIGFRKDEMSEINVKIESQPENLILTISNTNSFIPYKDLERIFEPLFTTKKNGTNKGLGLALTMSIVEAHNGKIKATSFPNHTSFEIILPYYKRT